MLLSPARILVTLLKLDNQVPALWNIGVGNEPTNPINNITLFDYEGEVFDKSTRNQLTPTRYAIQVRVRATSYDLGYDLISTIVNYLEKINQKSIVLGGLTYSLKGYTTHLAVAHLGTQETGKPTIFVSSGSISIPTLKGN